jgi:hypothetical protein
MVAGAFAVAALMLVAAMSGSTRPAYAAFHCMRIHAVMHGFNGDENAQFVELRMNSSSQNFVAGHKLRFLDASGVQKAEFTFPGNVSAATTGSSILIASREFNDLYTPIGQADFEFNSQNTVGIDATTPVQGPGGKVIFEPLGTSCLGAGPPIDSVAYGTGSVTADFGSKAVALPSPTTNQALRLNNLSLTPSNNSTEYTLETASTTTETIAVGNLTTDLRFPRNNARLLVAMTEPPVGGTVVEPTAPEQQARLGSDGDPHSVIVRIAAVTALILAAAAGVGALEMRRRTRT